KSAMATCMAIVVFPDPPFSFPTTITCGALCIAIGASCSILAPQVLCSYCSPNKCNHDRRVPEMKFFCATWARRAEPSEGHSCDHPAQRFPLREEVASAPLPPPGTAFIGLRPIAGVLAYGDLVRPP